MLNPSTIINLIRVFLVVAGLSYTLACDAITYNYDTLGRLLSANYGDAGVMVYNYDAAGNIVSVDVQASELLDSDGDGIPDVQDDDDDNDGIPDVWEVAHGLNPLYANDANQDRDGDGFSNLAEYNAHTDIANPFSHQRNNDTSWEAAAALNIGRDQFAAAAVADKIYVFGGNHAQGADDNTLEVLDLNNPGSWSLLSPNANGGNVEEIAGVAIDSQFYVFGAYGQGFVNYVESYQSDLDSWSSMTAMPTLRSMPSAVAYNGKAYLFGGFFATNTGKEMVMKETEAFDPVANSWQKLASMPVGKQREAAVVAVAGGKAYVLGGRGIPSSKLFGDIMTYDFAANTWQTKGFTPLSVPRAFPGTSAAPVLNGKIYLIGGYQKNGTQIVASDRVEIYDPASNTWQKGPSLPAATAGNVAVVANNQIYVIGGLQNGDETQKLTTVWKLDDAWKYNLGSEETCDLNADGKFSAADAAIFKTACGNGTAYWQCDLNKDGSFSGKDVVLYRSQWKGASKGCN